MNTRSLWMAVPLEKPHSIMSRALFRFLWCSVGGAIAILVTFLEQERLQVVTLAAILVCVITGIGVLVDVGRLWSQSKRNS